MSNSGISDHVEVLEVVIEEGVIFLDCFLELTRLFQLVVDYREIYGLNRQRGGLEFYTDYEGNVAPTPA